LSKKNRRHNRKWAKKHESNENLKLNKLIDNSGPIPALDHREIIKTISRGDNRVVSEAILKVLRFYSENTLRRLDETGLRLLNRFVTTVFSVMADPNFLVPKDRVLIYAANCHIFANVVAMSLYKTTDAVLQVVLAQENNLPKVCFLYTVRNELQLPISKFFDINPGLASRWYISALAPSASPTSELLYKNMKRFYQETDDRLTVFEDSCHVTYFSSSYIDGDCDAVHKPKINNACQRQSIDLNIVNTPKDNKIALVTSKWFPNSAVCKSARPLIERLFGKYHVTLIHTGYKPRELMTDCFDDVIYLEDSGIEGITKNDFKMLYYADIGMTPESVLMSNLRLAPIQVMSYGHPASTFGSKIDYFLGGEEVEDISKVQDKYTERMVLIPGMGCLASYPNYQKRGIVKDHDEVIIQATWGPDKYCYPLLMNLKKAVDKFEKPAKLHFYPSISINRNCAVLPFMRDIHAIFGDKAKVWSEFEYFDYMKHTEENSDILLNSTPSNFGCFNTLVEALYLDMPFLNCDGDTFRTKVGTVLNRRVGMEDWNTYSEEEWINKLAQIVNTGEWREKKKHLQNLDIKKAIFSGEEPLWFERAIDYLMEFGDQEEVKKERKPLIIREVYNG